jgi:hypothetical protein
VFVLLHLPELSCPSDVSLGGRTSRAVHTADRTNPVPGRTVFFEGRDVPTPGRTDPVPVELAFPSEAELFLQKVELLLSPVELFVSLTYLFPEPA